MRRGSLRRAVAGGVLALTGLVAACGGPTTHQLPRKDETDLARTWSGKQYVALGDSYTSAPNIGGEAAASGPAVCGQSDQNYPHLLAQRLGLKLRDVSCGGAQTTSMLGRQQREGKDLPPQVDAVGPGTRLVTLSVGGNDGAVFGNLMGRCIAEGLRDPRGAPCADEARDVHAAMRALKKALTGRLVTVLRAVDHRAPKARVLVVGYPQVVPDHGTCTQLPLAAGDYPFARTVIETLNAALSAAASRTHATFVDVVPAVRGHDICSSDPWIAGLQPARAAAPLHPYAEEQEAVATQVEKALHR